VSHGPVDARHETKRVCVFTFMESPLRDPDCLLAHRIELLQDLGLLEVGACRRRLVGQLLQFAVGRQIMGHGGSWGRLLNSDP